MPRRAVEDPPLEIACDESGFTGTNLVEPGTVLAHASVRIEVAAAEELVGRLRAETGMSDGELKAHRLLRHRARPVLRRLLEPTGEPPLQAWVHLSDTRHFLIGRLLDTLLGESPPVATDIPGGCEPMRSISVELSSAAPRIFGEARWRRFLTLGAALLRAPGRRVPPNSVERFFDAVDDLAGRPAPPAVHTAVTALRAERGAGRIEDLRRADGWPPPLLEPLIPALTRSALRWGVSARRLRIVHDEQSVLTRGRIDEIAAVVRADRPACRLEVVRVDSRCDPRVQLADLVAGIARRAASGALLGQPDRELVELVSPLVDSSSAWIGDQWRSDADSDLDVGPDAQPTSAAAPATTETRRSVHGPSASTMAWSRP